MASSTGEDPASSNQTSKTKPRPPFMDPWLLAAACSRSFGNLESLLKGTTGSSADDEEAILSETLQARVTVGGDTVLHVVATTNGDCEDFWKKDVLVRKAKNLLFMQNNMEDTPLHCAARAGNFQMVSRLIDLAKGQDNNASRVKALLEIENKSKWTALHEAVRSDNYLIVKLLMEEDPQLASLPKDGTSPLYIAILLDRKIIAKTLYELSGGDLSYYGPNGQNALHAAVQRDEDFTKMLLQWNNNLTLQRDENGSTPLHFAAVGQRHACAQLLNDNPNALYQQDDKGSFPTHVAASVGATLVIKEFLEKSPNCAVFHDAGERTFLHVAVVKLQKDTVSYVCKNQSLSWILNMEDNNGNTALHLTVQARSLTMFYSLFENRQVNLNLTNKKGETPRDIARRNIPKGVYYTFLNSEAIILTALKLSGAVHGIHCHGYLTEKDIAQERQDEIHQMEQVKEGSQSLCIGSVLIATVTFGASFAIPGGYRADDHTNGGTPTLVGRYAFDAFTLANALAFSFSVMSTISVVLSGSSMVQLRIRKRYLRLAYVTMWISVTSLVVAFALGIYTMLAPVAHKTAIAVCVLSSLILLYQSWGVALNNIILIV